MVDYVLDTHACVFALVAPNKLGSAARQAVEGIELGAGLGWIPAAVAAEIVLLRERRRIEIGLPELKMAMEHAPSLRFLPLDLKQLDQFAGLPSVRDPFDRLILSACRVMDAKLITKDQELRQSGLVQTIWT